MDPLFLGSAIGGLAGGALETIGNIFMQKDTQKENIKQWKMENEYNSPVNQMARLQSAGLNPNLVYGHGAVATGGNIAPVKSISMPNNMSENLSKFSTIAIQNEQWKQIQQQNENLKADAILKSKQAQSIDLDNRGKAIANTAAQRELGNISESGVGKNPASKDDPGWLRWIIRNLNQSVFHSEEAINEQKLKKMFSTGEFWKQFWGWDPKKADWSGLNGK